MTPNVCCPECGFEITKALAQARAEALEEAARLFTREADWRGIKDEDVAEIAAAIRALHTNAKAPSLSSV